MSLGFLNNILDSSINLFQNSLDSWSCISNLSFNNSLDLVQKINDVIFDFSRLNLGFDLVEDIFQILSSFHDVSDRDVFLGFQFVSKVSKMFSNGGNKVLNGMLQGWFQNIIQKIIKDVVSSNVILKLSNLGNDSLQEVNQKSLSRFNMSLGFLNNILDSSINLFQNSLDSWSCISNLSFNNSLDLVQKINDVIFDFSRLNLGFDLVEDIFQILSSFHDVSDRDVLLWFELVGKITKMFSNSGNEVLNGMFDCGFQDIIQEIIKDIVTSNTVFQLSQFGQDLLKKLN